MNFKSMKSMIEGLIDSFACPECESGVNDSNVDIIGAAGTTINIDIMCGNCSKHTMIKTEILSINLSKSGIGLNDIENIKHQLENNGKIISSKDLIKDKEIISLNKDLKQSKLNVSDLFGDK